MFCSNFEDIFDLRHFIDSLRDEVRIVRRLPKNFSRKYGYKPLEMPPVSWSNEKYYLEQVCALHLITFWVKNLFLIKELYIGPWLYKGTALMILQLKLFLGILLIAWINGI